MAVGGSAGLDDLLKHLLIWPLSPPGGLVFASINEFFPLPLASPWYQLSGAGGGGQLLVSPSIHPTGVLETTFT